MQRFTARLSRSPGLGDYLLAVGLAVVAAGCRATVDLFVPGAAYFIFLFPALVIAGVFCGTAPAVLGAAVGGGVAAALVLGRSLLEWPPLNASQLDALLFVPGCAVVLWATHSLRRTASQAAAAEGRLMEVFRQVPGAAAILEAPSGRLLLRSANSDAVLGHSAGRIHRSDDLDTYGGIHRCGRPYAADEYPIVRALKAGEIVQHEKIVYRRPDDTLADLEVHAGPVRGLDGSIVAAVGMAFDVTKRVAAERKLQESEARQRAVAERLRTAIDAGSLGLWEYDLTTHRIRLDAAVASMLGLPPEPIEMPREEFWTFLQPDDLTRANAVMDAAIAAGTTYSDEVRMRTADGEDRWFITRGAVLADLRQIVGVVSDVTERRKREDALHEALESRDILMREADHRIKNSLQLVISLLSLQINRVADPDAKAALGAAITRVEAIANAHLALERSPDLRSIEIDRMLGDLCGRLGSLNPSIAMRCETRSGLSLNADQAIPLGLLASEVLTNAMRHAYPPGAPGKVTLTTDVNAGVLEVTIGDEGAGMPSTPRRRGLGSTLIGALGRQIGATVNTQSRAGAGTTIFVRIPLPEGMADSGNVAGDAVPVGE